MEDEINKIEVDFALRILEAQGEFEVAQIKLIDLHAQKEEKIRRVREYYKALADKELAEAIISDYKN